MKMLVICCMVALLLPNFGSSVPIGDDGTTAIGSSTEALVIVSDEIPEKTEEPKAEPHPPQLKSMHVTSNIRNRYGRTVVSSKYLNPDERSQEATFSIILPDTAFISKFVMEIKGKKYEAYVREKEQAKKEYEQAVEQGLGAAHVAVSARDSNTFTVSVNVEPLSKVVFNLTYEQLLVRKHDKYEMVVNLNPGQIIKDLEVTVNINETRKIINVETPALKSGNEILDPKNPTKNEYAKINVEDDNTVHVTFSPTVEQQKEMIKKLKNKDENNGEDKGISGQFIVEYDVERDPQGGEVLVNDGYFVHFFAPTDLKPIPKHVVFVLDVSGSMYGRKLEQLIEAMKSILGELNPNDYFNLVKFHTSIQVLDNNSTWQEITIPQESELPEAIPATKENIEDTQNIVAKLSDEGLTNIYDALVVGLRLTSKGVSKVTEDDKHKPQPIIVFLTDGQANVGESRSEQMIEMVESRNSKERKSAIFALSFGDDANKEFLKELALKNSGFMRTIYVAADASLQLEDFYKQISSPLLTNVNFKYSGDQVKELTKHNFDILFKGSELVVAGKLEKPEDKFVTVEGLTYDGTHDFYPTIIPIIPRPEVKEEYGNLEQLWAYLTIKQLLDKKYEIKESEKNISESETPEKQALKLALKYSFVTPLTSLVVVKPNSTNSLPPLESASGSSAEYDSDALPLNYNSAGASFGGVFSNKVGAAHFAAPQLLAGIPGPPGQQQFYSTPASIRFTHATTTFSDDAVQEPFEEIIEELPWLAPLLSSSGEFNFNNKIYLIGNNETIVESKPCKVNSLNGTCTLISACPKVYEKINTPENYKEYFCSLDSDRFAAVCCTDDETN